MLIHRRSTSKSSREAMTFQVEVLSIISSSKLSRIQFNCRISDHSDPSVEEISPSSFDFLSKKCNTLMKENAALQMECDRLRKENQHVKRTTIRMFSELTRGSMFRLNIEINLYSFLPFPFCFPIEKPVSNSYQFVK